MYLNNFLNISKYCNTIIVVLLLLVTIELTKRYICKCVDLFLFDKNKNVLVSFLRKIRKKTSGDKNQLFKLMINCL